MRNIKEAADPAVIATDISLDEYMALYAAQHCEYVEGIVIQVSPADIHHSDIICYLYQLVRAYFELKPIGRILGQSFVMRLPEFPDRRREPDLLMVLNSKPHELKNTYMDGPAGLVIELVSEGSVKPDHGEKFAEYEKGAGPEYWIDHLWQDDLPGPAAIAKSVAQIPEAG